jgi:isopenicillin N synthase-like dioxygenase
MPDRPNAVRYAAAPASRPEHDFVPILDVGLTGPRDSARRVVTARAMANALERSGFMVLVGHGVPEEQTASLYRAAYGFFSGPPETAASVASDPRDPLQRGFSSFPRMSIFSANRLGENVDPGEAAAPQALAGPNRWPRDPGFRQAFLAYYRTMGAVASEVLRLLALALDMPENWFDGKFDRHMSPMMLNHYPAIPARATAEDVRNEPHTDISALTLLSQDDAPGGLQVAAPNGGWADVPPIPGGLVVNLGSLMTRWTNGRWASTVHRVASPPPGSIKRDRVSVAYFCQPNADAEIAALPGCVPNGEEPQEAPIRAGTYFLAKSRRAYLKRAAGARHS